MGNDSPTALRLLVTALLSVRDRRNFFFEDTMQSLLSMILEERNPSPAELEAALATMIRQKLLFIDEINESIDDAVQALSADRQTAQIELLQNLKCALNESGNKGGES